MLRGLELTMLHKQENLEEAVLTYPILFPSFDEKKERIIFLLLQRDLCFGLFSLVQAQKPSLVGQSQLTFRQTKTQILYFW